MARIKPNQFIDVPKEHPLRSKIENALERYEKINPGQLVFCLTKPLGTDEEIDYPCQGVVLMSPGHKIVFMGEEEESVLKKFAEYFLTDINSLSNKYKYQKFIGRYQEWEERIKEIRCITEHEDIDLSQYLSDGQNEVRDKDKRLIKYLISLSTGSINILNEESLNEGKDLLDEVKKKILLFDADQTRFLYTDYRVRKLISVQGLSGTGKTELLLHKLKEVYSQSTKESPLKIFFTCHNKALAREIKKRVPDFFNRMRFDQQINWDKDLCISHAWGSSHNPNSGLFSYICHYYNLPFQSYFAGLEYKHIYGRILEQLNTIPKKEFVPCLDYILVDENQDFPEVFFEVCKKVTRQKVYTAGDVFQNIFYQAEERPKGFDISLFRCYRTDPRTLMFAHTLGLGLKEEQRYNWFSDKEWNSFGYKISKNRRQKTITLSRESVTRFDGEDIDDSVIIGNRTNVDAVCEILNSLKEKYPTLRAGDVAIIMIDDDKNIYQYMDTLAARIRKTVGWDVIRGVEQKTTHPDMLYLTNTNNVKGLEFPFVICITSEILNDPIYRNKIYTMLTRSFLRTYLLVRKEGQDDIFRNIYNDIKQNNSICDIKVPSAEEETKIKHALLEIDEEDNTNISWDDFIMILLEELEVRQELRSKLKEMLKISSPGSFDKEKIKSQILILKDLV